MKKETFQLALFLKLVVLIILTISLNNAAYCQTNKDNCNCAKSEFVKGTKADTLFHLSNGKTIALCGYIDRKTKPTVFTEFTLTVCGQNKIIDFWGAVLQCRIQARKDTLLVHVLKDLPNGKGFKFQPTIWTTEKIYFTGQKIVRKVVLNRQIPKYTQAEIAQVLKSFENAKPGVDDNKLTLANELFIATISGNQKARQYFKDVNTKFGAFDGIYRENYIDLTRMLALWDKK